MHFRAEECLYNRSSSYAKFYGRSHRAVIRVYDDAGDVIETHKHVGAFKEL
jgi:hypothetical protein